jgi:GTPase
MGKRLRIYYMTQVETQPITFIMFVNYTNLMVESYKKYLYNRFREEYGFSGIPLVFRLKGKQRTQREKSQEAMAEHHPKRQTTHNPVVEEDNDHGDDDYVEDGDDDFFDDGDDVHESFKH